MFIKRLAFNVFDVFIGNGWDNWTRVRRFKDGGVAVIDGKQVNRSTITQIRDRLTVRR
jgi:hypothetical protein